MASDMHCKLSGLQSVSAHCAGQPCIEADNEGPQRYSPSGSGDCFLFGVKRLKA